MAVYKTKIDLDRADRKLVAKCVGSIEKLAMPYEVEKFIQAAVREKLRRVVESGE